MEINKLKKLIFRKYKEIRKLRKQAYSEYKACFEIPETLRNPKYPDSVVNEYKITYEIYSAQESLLSDLIFDTDLIDEFYEYEKKVKIKKTTNKW